MAADSEDDAARRSIVPDAAGRSLWLASAWTGVGAAVVCATLAIVMVAICWLPVSGPSGHSGSAIHAGLLTFLAALHGGITVDGATAAFLPLGLMMIVGLTAWRAGCGLADAANALAEDDPQRLVLAAAAQAVAFTIACLVAVPFANLGTSSAPFVGVGIAAFLLFGATGAVAFARSTPLADALRERVWADASRVLRAAVAGVSVYLGVGAVLVAGSVIVHLGRVEALTREVGGGWGSVPILLLCLLAVPNAVIAGAAYLAGPGFAVGTGGSVSAVTTAHGVLPAFPLLGAMPQGHGASTLVWWLMVLTPLGAGLAVARLAGRADTWRARLGDALAAGATAGVLMSLLAWQGGGAIGTGRLRSVGGSPWQVGLFVAVEVAVAAAVVLAVAAAGRVVTARDGAAPSPVPQPPDTAHPSVMTAREDTDDRRGAGRLAG